MRLYLSSYRTPEHLGELQTLLGGKKRAGVIVNAHDYKDPADRAFRVQQEVDFLAPLGLDVQEVDLRDYVGKKEQLDSRLKELDMLWVRGGNVFVLRRAMQRAGFEDVIAEALGSDRLVYAGYSAGACVLSVTLKGIEICDPIDVTVDGLPLDVEWSGLGIIPFSIAPHYQSDHPESASIDIVVQYFEDNNMPYRTLRDGQVIVINGESERVLG